MIVECNILCSKPDTLGIQEETEVWAPCTFDINEVEAVDSVNGGQARLFFKSGCGVITDLRYSYARHLFKFSRGGEDWKAQADAAWKKETKPKGYTGPRNEDC